MPRTVDIEKVGKSTVVRISSTETPTVFGLFQAYNKGYDIRAAVGTPSVITVSCADITGNNLQFTFEELVNKLGAINSKEYIDAAAEAGLFNPNF